MNPIGAGRREPAGETSIPNERAAPTVAVFALDAALAERLRDSLPRITLRAARTVPELADLLLAHPCRALGVEVAALGAGAPELLARLASLFPDLPVVALGAAYEAPIVAPLLASGEVHAFLARPIVAGAARDAFESALRRNAELARSAELRRAAVLRRSSTFLVQASRTVAGGADEASATAAVVDLRRSGATSPRAAAHAGRVRRGPAVSLAVRWLDRARGLRHLRGIALASGAAVLALAAAGTWLAHDAVAPAPTASSSAARVAAPRVADAPARAAEADPALDVDSRVHAAEQALAARRLDLADDHARAAAAALGGADLGLASRIAAVLDGVAAARRDTEIAARAEARWARAAREWERMRAAEAAGRERTSRTSEAAAPPRSADDSG